MNHIWLQAWIELKWFSHIEGHYKASRTIIIKEIIKCKCNIKCHWQWWNFFNVYFFVFISQGSDGGSVVFASTPAQVATTAPSPTVPRKTDFPSTGLPHRYFHWNLGIFRRFLLNFLLATDRLRWVVQALYQTLQVSQHQQRPQRQHHHKRHKCRFVSVFLI